MMDITATALEKAILEKALEKNVTRKKSMAYKKGSKSVEEEHSCTLSCCYPQHYTLYWKVLKYIAPNNKSLLYDPAL